MSLAHVLLVLIIAASALIYAIFAGKAQAGRLRSLEMDFLDGKLRGFAVIVFVLLMILAPSFL